RPPLSVHQAIHDLQPLEGVPCIKYTWPKGLVAAVLANKEHTAPVGTIDRRSADDHRDVDVAAVELLPAERHMLRPSHPQCREANRFGIALPRFCYDRVEWHLLAQVVDRVAVVGENRVDQVLADVMYVAEDRRQHHTPLGVALHPL